MSKATNMPEPSHPPTPNPIDAILFKWVVAGNERESAAFELKRHFAACRIFAEAALDELAAYRALAAAAEEVIKSNVGWRRSIDVATVSHGSLDGLSAALAAVRAGETPSAT